MIHVEFVKKFERGDVRYSLWRRGDYWYELTTSSQSSGYRHIAEWYNSSLEEIEKELTNKGYEPVILPGETLERT